MRLLAILFLSVLLFSFSPIDDGPTAKNKVYVESTTNLSISSTFTGPKRDMGELTGDLPQYFSAWAFSDVASAANGFKIEFSNDGTFWRLAAQMTTTAGTLANLSTRVFAKYYRVTFANSTTAQTVFYLASAQHDS